MLWKGRGRNRAFKRVGNLTFGSGVGGRPDMASKKKKMLERKGLPLAYLDPLGTRLPRIKVQVKCQQQRISPDGLSSFLAHVNEEDVGLFVNIGGFTKDAEEFARSRSGGRLRSLTLSGYWTFGSANVPLSRLVTLSRHWYAQSPIHAATRLEANRASLFNHFEWWPLIRSRRRCNSLVYRRPMSWQDARTQSLSLVTPSGGEST